MNNLEHNSIIAWLLNNAIKTESGKTYDLRSHPFWFDVLTDDSPKIVMLKAAQLGGSTTLALKMLWNMKRYGMNVAYTAPTDGDAQEFVSGKLNPIIRMNKVLDDLVEDRDSVQQKRIGTNTAYFRGTWTERAALSFSSDLNIHDELDRSNRKIVDQYASRLQHSNYRWEWLLSNPSTPGNGVHQAWVKSDQKHWFITCQSCKAKQFLSWPESIDPERKCYQCKKCHAQLTEDARRKGEWHGIKTDVKPEWSGYWFNLMMAPWVTAEEILKLHKSKTPDYFYNFVLGLPYAGSGNKLNEAEFFANLTAEMNMQKDPIVIGVDTGLPCWVVIGNKQGIFYNGHCDSMHDVEALMRRFPKAVVVMDQGGDLTAPRELREKYPGRVYLCYYRNDRKAMKMVDWGRGDEAGKVTADRNRVIQQLIDELRQRRIPIHGTREDWQEAWTHFANIYRTVEEDLTGSERIKWERNGPDHLVHAMTYWRIGMDKFQNDGAQYVTDNGDILKALGVNTSWDALQGGMPIPQLGGESKKDWREI